MTCRMRTIGDAEALRVRSELSELDPRVKGDAYVTEDGSQWNFSDLVDDLRVMQERRRREREAPTSEDRGTLLSSDGRGVRTEDRGTLLSSEGKQQGAASGDRGTLLSSAGRQQGARAEDGGTLLSSEGRQDGVPMEVGTTRKRAAEAEADDGERASWEETAGSAREMRSLSLLLSNYLLKERRCFTEAATP
eukprot:3758913-Amphidinium_carterae.1